MMVPDAPADRSGASGSRSTSLGLVLSLRPGQWTKNLLVFAPLLFAVKLFDLPSVGRAGAGFAVFCALSSVVYLLNDVMDREGDRQHPLKRRRPIAAGDVPVGVALATAAMIATVALASAFALGWRFGAVAAFYVILQTLYSTTLKHIVILDVLTLAIGFVLRAIAGAVVIDVVTSHWLFVCTILLALFIALAKRRHELVLLADGAASHRPILHEYSAYLLDQMIAVVTASTLIAYIFYTISPETEQKFGTSWLGLTIPFPLYGIFRYLYLVHQREGGGSPSDLLLNDRPLLACVTLWVVAVVLIVYHPFVP
ncbi:MAG TPA: decaprenyl-phosphate phosphoribosyltransferase [Vicinamibacterales bacterium]|nr:decaprenyl-phosphate phosphoribosyltransferase [Vicinamibacterales bacterium]